MKKTMIGSREGYGGGGRTNEREERGGRLRKGLETNVYTWAPPPRGRCTKNGIVVVRGG